MFLGNKNFLHFSFYKLSFASYKLYLGINLVSLVYLQTYNPQEQTPNRKIIVCMPHKYLFVQELNPRQVAELSIGKPLHQKC